MLNNVFCIVSTIKHVISRIFPPYYIFMVVALLLISCSGGDVAPVASTTTPTPTGTGTNTGANSIALSLSQTSVLSDSSDSATVTATVIKNHIPQEGVPVRFSTTAGLISSGSETTDSSGEAIINFQANPGNRSNQIATLTASADGINQSIPISISGTTITLSTGKTSLNQGEVTTLNIQVKDAGDIGIHAATVALSASNSNITLSATTGTTSNGSLEVIVSGANVGSTDIEVNSLGATKTITLEVVETPTALAIITPSSTPITILIDTPQDVTVSGVEGTAVTFVTSFGLWGNGLTTETQSITGGIATATLTSSAVGTATVQVYETAKPTNADTTFINVSPPITASRQVALTLSASSIAPSSDSISNSLTVYAKVITAAGEPVAGVPVTFSLSNSTGGGEYVDPPQVQTDSSGFARTTFYSGTSSSSGLGVYITATEQGSGLANSDTASIIIGGIAASISISRSTKISSSPDNTYYTLPMSVLVTDSSGAAVNKAIVSLSAWPTHYALGYNDAGVFVYQTVPGAGPYAGATMMPNEDVDRDLILDPGEDVGPCDNITACTDLIPDGELTPASSAGGSVPSTITTIENGTGSFELTYLKSSANWVETEISATVRVMGTESKTTSTFWLVYLLGEEISMPDSPFGHY
jgi:hypothetical protein